MTKKVYDDVYRREWAESMTWLCPHAGVIQKYGQHGQCVVSVYTCKKCRYAVKFKWHGGVACGYGTERKV